MRGDFDVRVREVLRRCRRRSRCRARRRSPREPGKTRGSASSQSCAATARGHVGRRLPQVAVAVRVERALVEADPGRRLAAIGRARVGVACNPRASAMQRSFASEPMPSRRQVGGAHGSFTGQSLVSVHSGGRGGPPPEPSSPESSPSPKSKIPVRAHAAIEKTRTRPKRLTRTLQRRARRSHRRRDPTGTASSRRASTCACSESPIERPRCRCSPARSRASRPDRSRPERSCRRGRSASRAPAGRSPCRRDGRWSGSSLRPASSRSACRRRRTRRFREARACRDSPDSCPAARRRHRPSASFRSFRPYRSRPFLRVQRFLLALPCRPTAQRLQHHRPRRRRPRWTLDCPPHAANSTRPRTAPKRVPRGTLGADGCPGHIITISLSIERRRTPRKHAPPSARTPRSAVAAPKIFAKSGACVSFWPSRSSRSRSSARRRRNGSTRAVASRSSGRLHPPKPRKHRRVQAIRNAHPAARPRQGLVPERERRARRRRGDCTRAERDHARAHVPTSLGKNEDALSFGKTRCESWMKNTGWSREHGVIPGMKASFRW